MSTIKLGTLGPEGTFSHQAVLKCQKYFTGLGLEIEILFEKSIPDLFRNIQAKYDIILVPLENSEAGSIGFVLDWLIETNKEGVEIIAEIDHNIQHYLSGWGVINEVTDLYSHSQSYNQCEQFIHTKLPNVNFHPTLSNAESARIISENHNRNIAAIVPIICTRLYDIPIMHEKIQNSSNNTTRFILCSDKDKIKKKFRTKISAKSSIILDPRDDHPGLLHEILDIFAQRMINLTKIQSRPSKRGLGDYIFYIDLQGDLNHQNNQDLIQQLKKKTDYSILGCYNQIKNSVIER